ncbi:YfiR/HmsC family protein [Aquimarina sp. 2201CG5-10]|uniref:YfiR/HmsC family protein n=1 Tax=Aquimarina callyspongiae TaxID=3098150 RepID=UPI002AB4A694|nr:YfiR/HmsC family protein [Aquimarina sp. 2201CG5-10]MDY8138006.1 YfiR/HmsC family protein [Aquimarina sp. 2201CG5-10]
MKYKAPSFFDSYIRAIFIIAFLTLFSLFTPLKAISQDTSNEEVKRLQRVIFIYNFAEQVKWPDQDDRETFRIGVLGPDRTILDLQGMALKRKIHDKPVEIVRFQLVKDVKDIQLLYVNQKYNYDIHYMLNRISEKNILLVSEDYNYNESMINMVNVEASFEYEINTSRIQSEGFLIASSLRKHAITSAQKWKRLYQKTEKSLKEVREVNKEQKSLITDKEEQIESQRDKISSQEKEITDKKKEVGEQHKTLENLYTETKLQKKKFEEKIKIERELEKNIQEQISFIKSQEEKIHASNKQIKQQQEFLKSQQEKIKLQEDKLGNQASEIDKQKEINILLALVLILGAIGAILIGIGYTVKRNLNIKLEAKNRAIHQQSLELESKNKELEQFAYIASHDLQEPLNTISSFIGLLAEDYEDTFDETGKDSLVFIQDASVRMKKLIDALLQYSRLGREKEYTNVDVNTVLSVLRGDFKSILERTKAIVRSENLPVVRGSEIELRLLLQNLISNAIKFTNPNVIPEIDITCVKKENNHNSSEKFWQFSVKDNGIGIPEEHKERIFAIFQRLHSRDQYQGTGIGLAHCKKIVESHGGKIWLESEEGVGSIFYFTIPI